MDWEMLEEETFGPFLRTVWRARVHAGWLVEVRLLGRELQDQARHYPAGPEGQVDIEISSGLGMGAGVGLTFVPDPMGVWDPRVERGKSTPTRG